MQRLPLSRTRHQESLACPRAGCNVASQLSAVENAVMGALLTLLPNTIEPKASPTPPPDPVALRRRQIAEQEKRLYTLVEQEVYSPDEFTRRRAALNQQKAALPSAPSSVPPPHPITTADAYARADAASRNAFLRLFIEKITYVKAANALPSDFSLEISLKE